jgi:hypothetical protein
MCQTIEPQIHSSHHLNNLQSNTHNDAERIQQDIQLLNLYNYLLLMSNNIIYDKQ